MMWTDHQLDRISTAEELDLASRRSADELSAYTTMWVVRTGDELYVRSANGPSGDWYRRARRLGGGRIRAGGVERDVTFVDVPAEDAATHAALDAAYHAKYDRYGARIVGSVVGASAATVTLRLAPLD